MSFTLPILNDEQVRKPSLPSRVTQYIGQDGQLRYKNADDETIQTVVLDGSPVLLKDQVNAPVAEPNKVKLHAKSTGSAVELHALDDLGREFQISDAGSLLAAGTSPASTWFPSGSQYTHTVSYVGGSGDQTTVTTIQVPLIADQMTSILFRLNLLRDDEQFSAGWRQEQFYWQGGVPALPDVIGSYQLDFDQSAGFVGIPYSTVTIRADGLIELTINSVNSYVGFVKLAAHSFDLPFPIGG